jgi:hypothetical protein
MYTTIVSVVLFVASLYLAGRFVDHSEDEIPLIECDPNKGTRKRKTQIVKSYVRTLSA